MKTLAKTTLALVACFVLTSGVVQALTDTWSGATSSDWSTGSNWSLGYAPTSADMARFMWSTANAPTLGAGSFITTKMYFFSSGTLPSYNFTGAGSANTTLKIDPNSGSTVNFIENAGGTTGGTNQTFSNLTLLLEDSNLTGQTKIQPGDGKTVTIASNATLQIGSTTAQTVILEANSPQTGSGALNINGVLKAGVTGSLLSVEQSGVLNLNLAAGSDFTNLQLSSKSGGVINFLAGGALGGSVAIYAGGVANVAASGITLNTTEWSIGSGGKIGTTYANGTSTLGGYVTISNVAGATNTFDVASDGILVLTNRVQLGSATAIVEKTGTGTLNLTYSAGAGNSFTASAFNVNAGTLLVNNTGSTSATGATVPVNVASGATLGGAGRITGNTTLNGGTINFSGGTIAANLGVNGGNWNGNGTVTGLTTSNNGTFSIGTGANLIASGNLTVAGGTITAAASTSKITGSVNYTSSANSTFIGEIAGAGKTLTMNATGATLTLSGTNSYTGSTTVTAGTLAITGSGNLTATSAVVVNGGSLLIGNTNAITTNATAVTMNSGNLTFATGLSSNQTFGALTMSSYSTLDFATTGSNILKFTGFASGSGILNILNWTAGSDHLYFASNTNLNASSFTFGGVANSAFVSELGANGYEITAAVPESGTILAGVLPLVSLAFAQRRRLKTMLNGRS